MPVNQLIQSNILLKTYSSSPEAKKNARKRIPLLAISQFIECKNRTLVASQLKISRTSVNKWVNQYLKQASPP